MRLLSLLIFACPIFAQVNQFVLTPAQEQHPATVLSATSGRTLYKWSVATVVAANGADAFTSWRAVESNHLVAGTGTQFGGTSLAIKSGFVGVSLLLEHVILRHRPDLYKRLSWINFATSGALGGVAYHNAGVR